MNVDLELPQQIEVAELISSRYQENERPDSWSERFEGFDVIRTTEGKVVKLLSSGGQSPPAKGWRLVLTSGEPERGYEWTLYGLPRQSIN